MKANEITNSNSIKTLTSYITKVLLIIGLLVFWRLFYAQIKVIVVPVVCALILAYLISPIVDWLSKHKVPKSTAIILIYMIIILLISIAMIFGLPKVTNIIKQVLTEIPIWVSNAQASTGEFLNSIKFDSFTPEVKSEIMSWLDDFSTMFKNLSTALLNGLFQGTLSSVSIIISIFMIFFIAYYAIIDGKNIKNAILWLVPKKWRDEVANIGDEANRVMYKYIRGQLIVVIIVSLMYMLVFSIIGLKYSILLGLIGGIFNALPYIGPYIGGFPAVLIGLTSSFKLGIITLIAIIIMQQIDNNLISPRVTKDTLGLSPLVSVLSILIGGEFFGVLGIIIAIPVAAITIFVIKKVIELRRKGETNEERYFEEFKKSRKN